MRARSVWAATITAALAVGGLTASQALASASTSAQASASAQARGEVHPARVYAPYFEAYLPGSLAATARQSGARFVTLAFVQAATRKGAGACTLTWNGAKNQPVSKRGYLAGMRSLRARGGDAIVSFGGFSADHDATEIADACHSVKAIAADYEQLVADDHVHRLDMDIEDNSLTNKGGIDRRDKAIAMLQGWARARHIPLWVQFTLGVEPSGFDKTTLGILRNARANGARVNSINLMVFDYYLGNEKKPLPMGALAVKAAVSVHRQLAAVYPGRASAAIWRTMGLTMLPGIDDYPHKTEVTHLSDARRMMAFARAHRMDFLSIWALQRDVGGCPGVIDSNTCSGIKQGTWAFSHLLEPFTG